MRKAVFAGMSTSAFRRRQLHVIVCDSKLIEHTHTHTHGETLTNNDCCLLIISDWQKTASFSSILPHSAFVQIRQSLSCFLQLDDVIKIIFGIIITPVARSIESIIETIKRCLCSFLFY